jgi:DNA-binding beta-propeller fold protein YncE
MKLSTLKKLCNRTPLIVTFCIMALISSCHDDNDKIPAEGKGTLIIESFNPQDYSNEGNASDIFLTIKFSGKIDNVKKLRLMLTSSPSSFKVGQAVTLPEDSYVEMDFQAQLEMFFPEGLKDADGTAISEGKSYTIFVLALPAAGSAPVFLEGPKKLTLVDEIVVITPKLKSTLPAMEDISIDTENNLYISGGSLTPSSLFKVTPDGTVTALSTTLNHPVGNTLDDNGNLYVTNFGSLDINLITPAGETSVFISDPKLFRGGGIIQDNDGALYNTFYAIKTIYRITADGVDDFLISDLLSGPVGLAYDEVNDKIFVANFNDGRIFQVSKDKTITQIADIPASIGHLDYRDGVLFATGWNEHKVFVVSMNGEILATIGNGNPATVNGPASVASFFNPNGIALSKDGKYLFISQGNGTLRKIVLKRMA